MNMNERRHHGTARRPWRTSFAAALLAGAVAIIASSCASRPELPPLSESELRAMKLIGATLDVNGDIRIDSITIHRREREISFPAGVNIREGVIEVLVSTMEGRTHESLLVTGLDPFKLQLALILFGARNGPATDKAEIPMGDIFEVEVMTQDGKRRPADEWLFDVTKDAPKKACGYVFVGSNFSKDNKCLASVEGNLININSMDENTILNMRIVEGEENDVYEAATSNIPEYDLKGKENPAPEDYWIPVTVVLSPKKPPVKSP